MVAKSKVFEVVYPMIPGFEGFQASVEEISSHFQIAVTQPPRMDALNLEYVFASPRNSHGGLV